MAARRTAGKRATPKRKPAAPPPAAPARETAADAAEKAVVSDILSKRLRGERLKVSELAVLRRFEARKAEDEQIAAMHAVPQKLLVALLGTTKDSILTWEAAGMPFTSTGREKRYDLFAILPFLRNRWMKTGATAQEDKKSEAQRRLSEERAESVRMEREIKLGQYVPRKQVEADFTARVTAVKAGLMALRKSVVPLLAEAKDEAEMSQVLEKATNELLSLYASGGVGH